MDENYYANVNPDILRFIPPDAGTVLEAGCGEGALGRAYKLRNPFCRYVGMEVLPQAAEAAQQYLDTVICGDVETVKRAKVIGKKETVDCLVYGDVLEHLRDPWRVLREQVSWLADTGQVIACIPNVQHWSVLAGLISGHWRYSDAGLLDRTHLRFFTLDSIRELFAQAGLYIHEIIPRVFVHPDQEKVQGILAAAAQELGVKESPTSHLQTAAMQYIVRATKQPVGRTMLLHSFLGETQVCLRPRIGEPHAFCVTTPGVRAVEDTKTVNWPPERPNENKVFIWQRKFAPSFAAAEHLIRRGYLIIFEMDDDPLRWKSRLEQDDYMVLRSCHAIQTSTEPLAAVFRQHNPHVAVFPNQIAELPPLRDFSPEGPVRLFFGAVNREEDWPEIIPILNECLSRISHQVTVVHDQRFFEALATENKTFVPFCPYPQYQQLLAQSDIALLPLADTHFNRMKSDLKFLECAANGVAALASPVVYADSIQDGKTGLIYRSPQEFGQKLELLLRDHDLRERIATEAYFWVKENRLLCRHYQARLVWYQALRDNYDNLTAEIYARMDRSR